ncbi:MAG: branched-chain amino acid ABC transporter substrate-binding protein [Nitratireductor sp.]|nr:branched-chain amino acid ABC transporter substrate-binding protein [Nitratireductor sp.]
MRNTIGLAVSAVLALSLGTTAAFAETIKIAYIEPLSGPFATNGNTGLAEWQYAAERLVNEKGGVLDGMKFEIVPFDNKLDSKEALIALQVAIDQGIHYFAHGLSSGIGHALTAAVTKNNARNPENRILYLNYSAEDPALVNDACSFWHFRWDADVDIRLDAITDAIAQQQDIKKVFLINQDYSFGKAIVAAAERGLAAKRPDIEIVGNELHPIGKVKDFTPYGRKIVASGAQAVITGNWGPDMIGVGKSAIDAGYDGPIYTISAASLGITRTFGAAGKDKIHVVSEGHLNPPASERAKEYTAGFEAKYPDYDIIQPRIANAVEMLARAIEEVGSAEDVVSVAYKLEGMEHDSIWGGKVYIRPDNHQAIQDIHDQVHTDEGITFPLDNSEYGTISRNVIKMASMDAPTTCKMERPERP